MQNLRREGWAEKAAPTWNSSRQKKGRVVRVVPHAKSL